MNNHKTKANKKRSKEPAIVSTTEPKAKEIKLGIEVHLDWYVVKRVKP